MKLFDNIDFNSPPNPLFDHSLLVDFVNYSELDSLSSSTILGIAEAYNNTPPNFQSLNDADILKVLKIIETEISQNEAQRIEEMIKFNHEIQSLEVSSQKKKPRLMSAEDALFH